MSDEIASRARRVEYYLSSASEEAGRCEAPRFGRAQAWLADERAPSLAWRIGAFLLSTLLTLAAAEAVVRARDGGALPKLRLFMSVAGGRIVLRPGAEARVGGPRGPYRVATDGLGIRAARAAAAPAPAGGWLAVGDSQVLGMGLDWHDTFAARLSERGLSLRAAGVPGYGVEDALEHAADLAPRARAAGVVVFVNQANDWEEWGRPIAGRHHARGGWLLAAEDGGSLRGAFMGSPLSRSHLLFFAAQFVFRDSSARNGRPEAPAWLADPASQDAVTSAMAAAIRRFATAHPDLEVVVCFLPVDFATSAARARVSPFAALLARAGIGAPWTDRRLRDQLRRSLIDTRFVDLTSVLDGRPEAFQDGDYHLSPVGHQRVADVLAVRLPKLALAREGGRS